MNAFPIGISALSAGQRGLDVVGQNVANATTPGYHRQIMNLATRSALSDPIGTGVDIQTYYRPQAPTVRTAILSGQGVSGAVTSRLTARQQIETSFGATTNSLNTKVDNFFNQFEGLSARPSDGALRRQAIASTSDLTGQFQSISGQLTQIRGGIRQTIDQQVDQINTYSTQIADLNSKIYVQEAGGIQANGLRDQRDLLVNNLSSLIDVRTVSLPYGVVNVLTSGAPLVVGTSAVQLQTGLSPSNAVTITAGNAAQPFTVGGGSLAGLIQEYNTDIPATQSRLDSLAAKLIQTVDSVQATGLGLNGPFTTIAGVRAVNSPTATLASQNLPIPAQSGNLVISVTNSTTGNRTNSTVAIDPATQSITDIATAITTATGGRVQATVDLTTNTLQFQAQSGFAFDFAGRVPNPPNAVAIGGTSVPTVGGAYTGAANDTYNFQITGTGQIGVTAGLSLQVTNSASQVVATLNVGSGYTAGSPLNLGNGVTVSLGAGTTTNGSFSAPLTANPDTSGILATLGVNSLFTGTSASDIALRPEVVADPNLLAASRTGQAGDVSNLTKFALARDTPLFAGSRTLTQEFTDIAATVGSQVNSLDDQKTSQDSLLQSLNGQEQSVIGVDINEETVQLLNYQRMVQAASKYMATVNVALDSILNILQ